GRWRGRCPLRTGSGARRRSARPRCGEVAASGAAEFALHFRVPVVKPAAANPGGAVVEGGEHEPAEIAVVAGGAGDGRPGFVDDFLETATIDDAAPAQRLANP